jgi:hypothetical protein
MDIRFELKNINYIISCTKSNEVELETHTINK